MPDFSSRHQSRPTVSFEFFPPKTEEMEENLFVAVEKLAPLDPLFASVTYGAGGTTRARTHEIVAQLQGRFGLSAAAHLTCVGATRAEINAIAQDYWNAGIRHIVALRGDLPLEEGQTAYAPHPDGYAYASDLVEGLLKIAAFEISVAAYPETHPEALSSEADLENLKRKVDAGATRAITQFFFDNEAFYRFRDKITARGITIPLLPGILPVTNFARAVAFATRCNTHIPPHIHALFANFDEKKLEEQNAIAEEVAARQCLDLQQNDVSHFHFYTLNRAELVVALCRHLGITGDVLRSSLSPLSSIVTA